MNHTSSITQSNTEGASILKATSAFRTQARKKSRVSQKRTNRVQRVDPDADLLFHKEIRQEINQEELRVHLRDLRVLLQLRERQIHELVSGDYCAFLELTALKEKSKRRIPWLDSIMKQNPVALITLSAKKDVYGNIDFRKALRTWNLFLKQLSRNGKFFLDGFVFFEHKGGQHPHIHIILLENTEREHISKHNYWKLCMAFGKAMKSLNHLDAEHCDIRLCDERPESLFEYLCKESDDALSNIEPLYKGQFDESNIFHNFNAKVRQHNRHYGAPTAAA
ncbi:hypothetical protein ACFOEE_13765 [Pseudoalteromonas fenneropenaei]|uniref:Inovirus Gp2 family protein n=1 Tax=Pseudoalteromonas fenneropenaei TaxID=1737459 RepID=A0ABV7CM19_9GAMM